MVDPVEVLDDLLLTRVFSFFLGPRTEEVLDDFLLTYDAFPVFGPTAEEEDGGGGHNFLRFSDLQTLYGQLTSVSTNWTRATERLLPHMVKPLQVELTREPNDSTATTLAPSISWLAKSQFRIGSLSVPKLELVEDSADVDRIIQTLNTTQVVHADLKIFCKDRNVRSAADRWESFQNSIATQCPNLSHLSLFLNLVPALHAGSLFRLSSLKKLNISLNCHGQEIGALIKDLPNLEELCLEGVAGIGWEDHLESQSLRKFKFGFRGMMGVPFSFPRLESFTIGKYCVHLEIRFPVLTEEQFSGLGRDKDGEIYFTQRDLNLDNPNFNFPETCQITSTVFEGLGLDDAMGYLSDDDESEISPFEDYGERLGSLYRIVIVGEGRSPTTMHALHYAESRQPHLPLNWSIE